MKIDTFKPYPERSDMSKKVMFDINLEKALEVVVWLANARPGIDIYHIAKVIFFADKKHLNGYARPVVGDAYKKMLHGPVPSSVLDIINLNGFNFPEEFLDEIERSISVRSRLKKTYALREPNLDVFSRSDLRCLMESLEENGDKSFGELRELTHDEPCYVQTADSDYIDYRLMIDDENEHAEEIRGFISEQSKYTHL